MHRGSDVEEPEVVYAEIDEDNESYHSDKPYDSAEAEYYSSAGPDVTRQALKYKEELEDEIYMTKREYHKQKLDRANVNLARAERTRESISNRMKFASDPKKNVRNRRELVIRLERLDAECEIRIRELSEKVRSAQQSVDTLYPAEDDISGLWAKHPNSTSSSLYDTDSDNGDAKRLEGEHQDLDIYYYDQPDRDGPFYDDSDSEQDVQEEEEQEEEEEGDDADYLGGSSQGVRKRGRRAAESTDRGGSSREGGGSGRAAAVTSQVAIRKVPFYEDCESEEEEEDEDDDDYRGGSSRDGGGRGRAAAGKSQAARGRSRGKGPRRQKPEGWFPPNFEDATLTMPKDNKVRCDQCFRVFGHKRYILKHQKESCPGPMTEERALKLWHCKPCALSFTRFIDLRRHLEEVCKNQKNKQPI